MSPENFQNRPNESKIAEKLKKLSRKISIFARSMSFEDSSVQPLKVVSKSNPRRESDRTPKASSRPASKQRPNIRPRDRRSPSCSRIFHARLQLPVLGTDCDTTPTLPHLPITPAMAMNPAMRFTSVTCEFSTSRRSRVPSFPPMY
jgi:hypothetical protein